jgi:phosphoribosylformylglycinamidine synthase
MTFRRRAIIPWFPGTNCHQEMAYAFELAGANPKIVTIFDLAAKRQKLSDTDLIGLAGGFSYGDHFRSGAVAANDLLTRFRDELAEVLDRKIPVLGVCNGFQILMETGLLPGNGKIGKPTAVLDRNVSTRFEHWCDAPLCFSSPRASCIWTSSLDGARITLPVAHGAGRPVPEMDDSYFIVATYGTRENGVSASPNGSPIAGICTPNGLICGMMPHPERRVDTHYGGDQGLVIFKSGVNYVR